MKSIKLILAALPFQSVYANDLDAFVPEIWAQEGLAILEENMVAANMIHRNFEDEIARFGDVVNTRRPGEYSAKRKTTTDNVTDQDSTATNVQVQLDQHVHVSFVIRDGEESKSMQDLVATYLQPAMLAHARFIDQIVLGQYVHFLNNNGGKLGTAGSVANLLEMRQVMNENKAYVQGRNLILTPSTETDFLNLGIFTQAEQVGDGGTALQEAILGRKYGYNMYMCQNMSSIATGNTTAAGAVNNSGGYSAGTTTLTVDTFSGAVGVNSWLTIAGDMTPQRVTAVTNTLGATTSITLSPGLRYDVADNAAITSYTPGAVNLAAGYAAGYAKEIVVDGFTVAPRVGQAVSFGTTAGSAVYTIIDVTGLVGITLDRPLEAAIADNAAVNIGPAGNYNLAMHRNAIALVMRPLAMPPAGTGARSAVVNYNGLGLRAVITYDGQAQGTRVTLDVLCGVKVLDTNLGAVLLA